MSELGTAGHPLLKHFHRPEIRRILSNTGWLAGDRFIRLGMGLFVTSWIARYLGPERFGLLNFAIAFVYLFSILGALGLDSIVIRSLIREPESRDRVLCTTFLIKLTGGSLSFVLSVLTLFYIHADRTTMALIVIIGLGRSFRRPIRSITGSSLRSNPNGPSFPRTRRFLPYRCLRWCF